MGKILLIVGALLIVMLIAASALGYFFYLGPKMQVKSFSSDLAPLLQRDMQLNDDLNAFAEKNNDDEEEDFDAKEILDELEEGEDKVNSARRDYESFLTEVNQLESSAETDNLKRDVADLNRFYIDRIPRILEEIEYLKKMLEAVDGLVAATEIVTSAGDPATQQEAVSQLKKLSGEMKASVKELQDLDPPENLRTINDDLISLFTDVTVLLDETAAAIGSNDPARLSALESKYEKVGSRFEEDANFGENEEYTEYQDEVTAGERAAIEKVQNSISALRASQGERWIVDDLRYQVDEGWLKVYYETD